MKNKGLLTGAVCGIMFFCTFLYNKITPKQITTTPSTAINQETSQKDSFKIAERKIQNICRNYIKHLDYVFPDDTSLLSEMPRGGVSGQAEDYLRQYLEYLHPRLKILASKRSENWQNILKHIIESDHLKELRGKIEQKRAYFEQTCNTRSQLQFPKKLTIENKRLIKIYAWEMYQKYESLQKELSLLSKKFTK